MLTKHDIAAFRNTWEKVLPIREQAADLFYGQLFELDSAREDAAE